jgi:NAD-reducing hydrogenase large subunit
MRTQPEVARKAYNLRKAGQRIVEILGKRATHPVSLGLGGFLVTPTADDLEEVRKIALQVKEEALKFIHAGQPALSKTEIAFPPEQQVNLLAYDGEGGRGQFQAFDRQGRVLATFAYNEFSTHVSEMAAEWSFAKFPYLTRFGFPQGILLVGPLARSCLAGGPLKDPEMAGLDLARHSLNRESLTLENLDVCRLLEIFWAARRILSLLAEIREVSPLAPLDTQASGQGFGILEAPRGTLIHNYIVNRGCLERARLLVATQFNNAYINLLIHDLAEKHLEGDRLSPKGEWLIGRCIRLFDPCLSCATH